MKHKLFLVAFRAGFLAITACKKDENKGEEGKILKVYLTYGEYDNPLVGRKIYAFINPEKVAVTLLEQDKEGTIDGTRSIRGQNITDNTGSYILFSNLKVGYTYIITTKNNSCLRNTKEKNKVKIEPYHNTLVYNVEFYQESNIIVNNFLGKEVYYTIDKPEYEGIDDQNMWFSNSSRQITIKPKVYDNNQISSLDSYYKHTLMLYDSPNDTIRLVKTINFEVREGCEPTIINLKP